MEHLITSDEDIETIGKWCSTSLGGKALEALNRTFKDRNCFDANNQRRTDFMLGQCELVRFLNNTVKAVEGKDE